MLESGPTKSAVKATVALVVLGACGAYITVVLPAIGKLLIEQRGLSGTEWNQIVGAEKFGMMASSLGLTFLIQKLDRKRLALGFLALLALSNGACAWLEGFGAYATARFVCGVAEGGVIAIMTGVAANLGNADRVFGLYLALTLGISWLGFESLGSLLSLAGLDALFFAMAAISVAAAAAVPALPGTQQATGGETAQADATPASNSRFIGMALAATLLFEMCIGAVWNNLPLIAGALHYTEEQITGGMAWAMPVGIAGGLLSSMLGDRLGRALPLTLGVGVLLVAQVALKLSPGASFLWVSMGFMASWMFTLPYFVGAVAALDTTGRAAVASIVVQTGGLMLGPLIAGEVIRGNDQYPNILGIGLMAAAGCLVLILPAVTKRATALATPVQARA